MAQKQKKTITSYRHPPSSTTNQKPVVDSSRVFYVTVRERLANDGSHDRYAFLAGPLATHQEALDLVDACSAHALAHYDRAEFYGYGTAGLPRDYPNLPLGLFNSLLVEFCPEKPPVIVTHNPQPVAETGSEG